MRNLLRLVLGLCLCLTKFTSAWRSGVVLRLPRWHQGPAAMRSRFQSGLQLRGSQCLKPCNSQLFPQSFRSQTSLLGPSSCRKRPGCKTLLSMSRESRELVEDSESLETGESTQEDYESSQEEDDDRSGNWGRLQRKTLEALDGIIFSGAEGGMKVLRRWMKKTTGLGEEIDEDETVEVELLDRESFSQALHDAGMETMNEDEITEVFEEIDNDRDGTLTMEEMCDAYLRVNAEVYEDDEESFFAEEEEVVTLDEPPEHLPPVEDEEHRLRPDAPGLEVDRAIPFPTDEPAAPALLSRQWAQVCEALMRESAYLPAADQERLLAAVRFAGKRLLGAGEVDDEFGEGLALAGVVAALEAASPAVISAMLLPCVASGAAEVEEVRLEFGPVVASILQDVLWLRSVPEKVGLVDDDSSRVLREYIVAATLDHRSVIVLLADRIQLLRKSGTAPLYEQHLKALESLQVFSPLAHALGVGKLLWELEDLSFRALFPDSYASVEAWQLELWADSDAMMEVAKVDILSSLNANPYLCQVVERYAISSRRKSVFSTFKKMFRKNKRREQVNDVFAMRVVIGMRAEFRLEPVAQVQACLQSYQAVLAALKGWTEPKGRFKDYVTFPKPNGYQSIHTTMYSPGGLPLEIQLRTEEMHAAAEFGNAAHNLYKGGIKSMSAGQRFAESIQKDHAAVLLDDADLTVTDDETEALEASEAGSEQEGYDGEEASSEEYTELTEEESTEGPGRRRRLGALELEGMILTAPSVAPEPDLEEEEVPWSSVEIGQELVFERSFDDDGGGGGGGGAAADERGVTAKSRQVGGAAGELGAGRGEEELGLKSEMPLQRSLRELKEEAEVEMWRAARAVEGGAQGLAVLRVVGQNMMARQERLRALLDAESARMFDPASAVLGTDLPPQLGPLGAGTVSLVRGGREEALRPPEHASER